MYGKTIYKNTYKNIMENLWVHERLAETLFNTWNYFKYVNTNGYNNFTLSRERIFGRVTIFDTVCLTLLSLMTDFDTIKIYIFVLILLHNFIYYLKNMSLSPHIEFKIPGWIPLIGNKNIVIERGNDAFKIYMDVCIYIVNMMFLWVFNKLFIMEQQTDIGMLSNFIQNGLYMYVYMKWIVNCGTCILDTIWLYLSFKPWFNDLFEKLTDKIDSFSITHVHVNLPNAVYTIWFDNGIGDVNENIVDYLPQLIEKRLKALDVMSPVRSTRPTVNTNCSICLDIIDNKSLYRELPKCKHIFHADCLDKWFLLRYKCPNCQCDYTPT